MLCLQQGVGEMSNKIISLATVTKNPVHESAEKVLRDILADLKNGEFGENPRFVMCINPRVEGPGFATDYVSCGLDASQAIGLLEVVKLRIYKERT